MPLQPGMTTRKIPVPDDVVAAGLDAGTSQRDLAQEYGVTKTAIAKAAARHRDLQARVALGESAVRDRERRVIADARRTAEPRFGPVSYFRGELW